MGRSLIIALLLCVACQRGSSTAEIQPSEIKQYTKFGTPVGLHFVQENKKSRVMQCGEESVHVGLKPVLDEKSIADIEHRTYRRLQQWVLVKKERPPDWKMQVDVATMKHDVEMLYGKNVKFEPIGKPEEVMEYELLIRFSDVGSKLLAQVTRKFVGKKLAVVIGDHCLSAATIVEPLEGGAMSLVGFDVSQQELSKLLR